MLNGVTKRFGDVTAVADISFGVAPRRIVALLGPSGCGKTTTLRIIAGFVEPDAGALVIDGRDMRGVRPYERNIGLVFQDYALFPASHGLRRTSRTVCASAACRATRSPIGSRPCSVWCGCRVSRRGGRPR
ncbi:MAG: ATP-binding cassette domain-containing protein [Pseudomonadota bacterium]